VPPPLASGEPQRVSASRGWLRTKTERSIGRAGRCDSGTRWHTHSTGRGDRLSIRYSPRADACQNRADADQNTLHTAETGWRSDSGANCAVASARRSGRDNVAGRIGLLMDLILHVMIEGPARRVRASNRSGRPRLIEPRSRCRNREVVGVDRTVFAVRRYATCYVCGANGPGVAARKCSPSPIPTTRGLAQPRPDDQPRGSAGLTTPGRRSLPGDVGSAWTGEMFVSLASSRARGGATPRYRLR